MPHSQKKSLSQQQKSLGSTILKLRQGNRDQQSLAEHMATNPADFHVGEHSIFAFTKWKSGKVAVADSSGECSVYESSDFGALVKAMSSQQSSSQS